jgi:C-terminal processing protease CtpA/Prc
MAVRGWPAKTAKSGAAPALPVGAWRADKTYPEALDPSPELRLLAVIRFWTVIDLFYPYKALIGDWDAVLPEFLGKMAASQGARGYAWALAAMAARIADAHTGLNGHPELEALYGVAPSPVGTRWIEDGCVVTAKAPSPEVEAAGVELGDAVESVDGKAIGARMEELRPYVAGATPLWLQTRLCGAALMGGKDSQVDLVLRGLQGERKELHAKRSGWKRPDGPEAVRMLPGNFGYADLTRLTLAEVDGMFERFKETRGIVFDMRGYPRGTAWSIGPRLNVGDHPVAAQFRRNIVSAGNADEEGASGFYFSQPIGTRKDGKYTHPTVMLIDERAISQSEHSGLFYEAANGTRFIGAPTAGSNGDVTDLTLPGGIEVFFTGHDVRHADGRQLQRVGLVPDVKVAPTRAGLKAGKDEVLERAIEDLEATLAMREEAPAQAAKPR